MQPKKKAGNNFNERICVMITCSSELFAERSHFLLWRRFKSELGYVNLRHICFRKINYSPVLFSILDSSPLRTPPTHSHTRRRNTPVSQFFCPWEKSEKENTSGVAVLFTNLRTLNYYICIILLKLNLIQWFHFSQIPMGFEWLPSAPRLTWYTSSQHG